MMLKRVVFAVVLCTSLSLGLAIDGLTLTPFGYWPKECVHGVPSGSHIDFDSATNDLLVFADGSLVTRHKRCDVFDSDISLSEYVKRRSALRSPARSQDFPDGWAAYTEFDMTDNCELFNGKWTVPPQPADKQTQTVFLFTGLQNSPSSGLVTIIQPVLTWGVSEAGGGNYWTVASWFVGADGSAVYSAPQNVTTGHHIGGNMTYAAGNWTIRAHDLNTGVKSDLSVAYTTAETSAFVTLEVYSISSCGDYPTGSVDFNDLVIHDTTGPITAQWQPTAFPGCEEAVKVVSPSDVVLTF